MRFSGNTHHLVGSVAAVFGVLALGGATIAWQAGEAAALPPRPVVAVVEVVAEPPPSSTSTSTSSSSTSTSTSTSTTTTVKPRPATTTTTGVTSAPRVTAPPVAQPPPSPLAQATSSGPAERCAAARQWVAAHGLVLPAGWGFRCPGQALVEGTPRWGMACWNCEGTGSWIAIDITRIGASEATLRHVIAHEICHALEYTALALTTELTADLCAALHGAPRP